jgi:hypothetical protein
MDFGFGSFSWLICIGDVDFGDVGISIGFYEA